MATRDDALLPAVAGFLLALALARDASTASVTDAILARAPDALVRPRELDPDAMCARDLRRLPAIGPARALAIVRARFERGWSGGPAAWERIPGIGPETVRAARAWLAAAGAVRLSGGAHGAYTPPGRRP